MTFSSRVWLVILTVAAVAESLRRIKLKVTAMVTGSGPERPILEVSKTEHIDVVILAEWAAVIRVTQWRSAVIVSH